MSDITMCSNKQCPQFQSCYRAQAIPSEFWQSYAEFEFDSDAQECAYYWETKG